MRYAPLMLAFFAAALLSPGAAFAQATTTPAATTTPDFQVSGWIPYWKVSDGTRDARKHLDALDVIHPFALSVQPDGRLKDLAGLTKYAWTRLFRDARTEGTLVIPTVMWSDTNAIHTILSDPKERAAHIKRIVSLVKNGRYDGIDIDYEGKRAETRDSYSAFLGELKTALGDKMLSCTVEARTPPESLYPAGKIPKPLEYANDFSKLNEYCDQVNIMAYDQQRADLKLNAARVGAPYYPVADAEWVRKVVTLARKDIDAHKIVLSVPTYGRELEVTVAPQWFQNYAQLWSVSNEYALDTAKKYGATVSRSASGELGFSYVPEGSPYEGLFTDAASALAYANTSGKTVKVNFVAWSDAQAIADKVALAKELGLRGIAIFKIDGGEDPDIWAGF